MKEYVEQSWRLKSSPPDDKTINDNAFDLTDTWAGFVQDPSTLVNTKRTHTTGPHPDHPTIFNGALKDYREPPTTLDHIAITKGSVIRIQTLNGERWYQPVVDTANGQTYPSVSDFLKGKWAATWETVTALVQIYYPGKMPKNPDEQIKALQAAYTKAQTQFPAIELIRADAATIYLQYQNLMKEKELEDSLSAKATQIAQLIPTVPMETLPTLMAQFRQLKNFGTELKSKKRQLSDAASDLNYHLFIEDTTITVYDGSGAAKPMLLKEGELYIKSRKTISWITYQTVTETDLFGLEVVKWQIPITHSKTFDYYENAPVTFDPWIEILDLYKSNGYETYLFRYTEIGLQAPDGTTPKEVLSRCHNDEAFRSKCVIALPYKEVTLIGQTFIVGYYLFIRPVPDIVITSFPELSIRERLSYRFTWTGVALGDLAATIPLSPGEQREVTLTTSRRYEFE